ncbi:MAG TPA: aminotransferase class V-fold PLP-dependent enzyme [Micromonosporaceae bacterium]|jgi:glutamate/tyrosine decarboxylase-like PLP-dependent enzyme
MDGPPLNLPTEEFRELADRVVEAATRYLGAINARPIRPHTTGEVATELFARPAPEEGLGVAALDDLALLADHSRAGNSRFFGYVLGSGEPVGALADLYASVLNQNVTAWRSAPSAVTIERTVVSWIAEAVGCPGFGGVLTSGGSTANLMGLAMAREARAPANVDGASPCVIYASTEAHLSIDQAAAVLGIGRANVRAVPVDERFRMRPDALETAVAADREHGLRSIAVVANGGTVVSGAVDPLADIAAVAKAYNLWLHVDGAYGVAAALAVPETFAGLDQADSVSLDAHKWLYQPLDCGVLLYRDPLAARRAFSFEAGYIKPLSEDPVEAYAFFDESLETSRRFRALKLWLSLRYHGLEAYRSAIRQNLRQARLLADLIDAEATLERLAPVELSAVCFRWIGTDLNRADLDGANAEILAEVNRRGRVYLSNADIGGTFSLRACITNHRTTDEDVAAVVAEVLAAAAGHAGSGANVGH